MCKRAIVIFVLLLSRCWGSDMLEPGHYCERSNLPFTVSVPNAMASAMLFSSHFQGKYSVGTFEFQNRSQPSILQLTLVVEYLNEQNEHILSMPFHYSSESNAQTLPLELSSGPYLLHRSQTPIAVGERTKLMGISPILLTGCPSRARTIFAAVTFSDRTEFNYTAPDWSLEAALRHPDEKIQVKNTPLRIPFHLLVRAQVSADTGRINSLEAVGNRNSEALPWLEEWTRAWVFTPAIRGNKKVDGTLNLLFRFHDNARGSGRELSGERAIEISRLVSHFTIVDVVPSGEKDGSWNIYYAGTPF